MTHSIQQLFSPKVGCLLFLALTIFLPGCGCSQHSNESSASTVSRGLRGLNLTAASISTKTNCPAAVSNPYQIFSASSLTASSGWSTTSDASRYAGNYVSVTGDGSLRTLTGSIVLNRDAELYVSHNIWTDTGAFSVTVGTTTTNVSAGTTAKGWSLTSLGFYPAGTYAVTISSSAPWPQFLYFDSILALPPLTLTSGEHCRLWWEQDNASILKSSTWGTDVTNLTFPFSVATYSGSGALYNANSGEGMLFTVTIPSGGKLRIVGRTGSDQGQLNVTIDGVAQTAWDQYSSTVQYRATHDFTVAAGTHLVQLSVSGSKNASSSGYQVYVDAISVPLISETDDQRALRMIDYIASNIRADDGGGRTAFDSAVYNQDNDMGYSAMALALALQKWNYADHKAALQKLIAWFGTTLDVDSNWHWGYSRNGSGNYSPYVSSYYTSLSPSVTDIKSIDAPQSFPVVALAIYAALYPGDTDFILTYRDSFVKAIDALIENNYDSSNGFFYSSYQFKNGSWQLFEAQYSAGQADVYMGLMAAYSLTSDSKYKVYADAIKQHFDEAFWSPSLGAYSVALSGPRGGVKTMDSTTYYPFTQGWVNWVFGSSNLTHGLQALGTMSSWVQGDGYSIQAPGQSESETNNSAWLAMGLKSSGSDETLRSTILNRMRVYQCEFAGNTTNADGGVAFSSNYPYFYTANSAWAFLALTSQPSPETWWK